MVNASISIKQIITINREYELYLTINKILIGCMNNLSVDKDLENAKYYGILKFYMSPKVNQFI